MSKRWAIRTVRNGRVRIGGKVYRPQGHHLAYDGRLDGMRFLFGRYAAPWKPGGWEPFVCLWGTERAYLSGKDEDMMSGPDVVDGTLPWSFWEEVSP